MSTGTVRARTSERACNQLHLLQASLLLNNENPNVEATARSVTCFHRFETAISEERATSPGTHMDSHDRQPPSFILSARRTVDINLTFPPPLNTLYNKISDRQRWQVLVCHRTMMERSLP